MSFHSNITIPATVDAITDKTVDAFVQAVEMNRGPGRWSGPPCFGVFSDSDGLVLMFFPIVGAWIAAEGEKSFEQVLAYASFKDVTGISDAQAEALNELFRRMHAKIFPDGEVPSGPPPFPVPDRIVTPRFRKGVQELQTWDLDIRQVLSDNPIKDQL